MILDIEPLNFLGKDEFRKNQPWADSIYKKSGGLPVVFINSYQMASRYWFYTGVPSFSLNTPIYRRNNYNFWTVEDSLYNKRIAVFSLYNFSYYKDSILTPRGRAGMIKVDSFFSFSKVKIFTDRQLKADGGFVKNCTLEISAEENHIKAFQSKKFSSKPLELIVIDKDKTIARISTNIRLSAIRKKDKPL